MKRIVVAGVSGAIGGALAEALLTWYAYRSSKAALNMLVRTLSVELPRRCKPIACVSLHPGTTDSALSDPFRQSLAQLQVHSATETAGNLLKVIEGMTSEDNGRFLSWDGSELPW
jgi:NAD(P)-dependent dehydrogenase (short-subunit alcohol dehydrogenase family)